MNKQTIVLTVVVETDDQNDESVMDADSGPQNSVPLATPMHYITEKHAKEKMSICAYLTAIKRDIIGMTDSPWSNRESNDDCKSSKSNFWCPTAIK